MKFLSEQEKRRRLKTKLIKAVLNQASRELIFTENINVSERLVGIIKQYISFDFTVETISTDGNGVYGRIDFVQEGIEAGDKAIRTVIDLVIKDSGIDFNTW